MNTTISRHGSMDTTNVTVKPFTSVAEETNTRYYSYTSFNTTNSDEDQYYYPDDDYFQLMLCSYERHGAYFLPVLFTLFFLLGLVGNVLVLLVIVCGARLRSMTDVCLLNLAVADLLLVCTLPFQAHHAWDEWVFGDAMCKVVLGLYHIVLYCGIFFICLMSIDRYLAIVHAVYAMRVRTRSFGMIAAAVIWVTGFLASFPDIIFIQQRVINNNSDCYPYYPKDDKDQTTHFWGVFSLFKMNVLGLFVPLLIIGFCYLQIIRRLMSSQTTKKQTIRLVLVVVSVFFCCWVPYNIVSFFKALELLDIYTECDSSKAITLALQITEAVAYSHSCLNPILYVFVGEKFRRHLIRLMNRAPCRLCQLFKVLLPKDSVRSVYSQTTSLDERSTAV